MTDILELAKKAGALQYIYEGGYTEYRFTTIQLEKLESLLREKFIAELGEPEAYRYETPSIAEGWTTRTLSVSLEKNLPPDTTVTELYALPKDKDELK